MNFAKSSTCFTLFLNTSSGFLTNDYVSMQGEELRSLSGVWKRIWDVQSNTIVLVSYLNRYRNKILCFDNLLNLVVIFPYSIGMRWCWDCQIHITPFFIFFCLFLYLLNLLSFVEMTLMTLTATIIYLLNEAEITSNFFRLYLLLLVIFWLWLLHFFRHSIFVWAESV